MILISWVTSCRRLVNYWWNKVVTAMMFVLYIKRRFFLWRRETVSGYSFLHYCGGRRDHCEQKKQDLAPKNSLKYAWLCILKYSMCFSHLLFPEVKRWGRTICVLHLNPTEVLLSFSCQVGNNRCCYISLLLHLYSM